MLAEVCISATFLVTTRNNPVSSLKIENKKYKLFCNMEDINPSKFADLERTKEVVITILKKFINQYYKKKRLAAEKNAIEIALLYSDDEKILKKYDIKIKPKDRDIVRIVEEQTATVHEKGYQVRFSKEYLRNAFYSKHLYQPLLSKPTTNELTITPTGLNEGEKKFVTDLQNYLSTQQLNNTEIYLLRNQTRGKGVGFFEENSFYPDFIMWIKEPNKQKIVFIDPKGVSRLTLDHPKLNLHKHLKTEIEPKLELPGLTLDAYVLAVTPFDVFVRSHSIHKTKEQLAEENTSYS